MYALLFLLIGVTVGCSNNQGQINTAPDHPTPNVISADAGKNPSISDCSNLIVPKNTEVNTNVNKEKELLFISWYDETKGEDITSNCSTRSSGTSYRNRQMIVPSIVRPKNTGEQERLQVRASLLCEAADSGHV